MQLRRVHVPVARELADARWIYLIINKQDNGQPLGRTRECRVRVKLLISQPVDLHEVRFLSLGSRMWAQVPGLG